jgi:hypothetical protein
MSNSRRRTQGLRFKRGLIRRFHAVETAAGADPGSQFKRRLIRHFDADEAADRADPGSRFMRGLIRCFEDAHSGADFA